MAEENNSFDPEVTISEVSPGDNPAADYRELREEFHVSSGNDGSAYRVRRLLGIGGIGVVYSADEPTLERSVALKMLREPFRQNQEQIAKFIHEARITAKIDHPNVVAVHQLGISERNGVYFSMRRVGGETLQNALRRLREGDKEARRQYTPRRLLDIFIAGCNAVAAAHEKRVLHCDLKPANIMIGSFGEVLVLDWGLAREFDTPPPKDTSLISGTPAFMAPELVTGTVASPDELTEVYALGTILYSIITWRQSPYDREREPERSELFAAIAAGRHLPLRPAQGQRINAELAAICRRAMALDRSQRYHSVAELLDDLHNYRDGFAVGAYSPNRIYRFFKMCRRHPAVPVAAMVALLTLIVYRTAFMIDEFARDRMLMNSAAINFRVAEDYYRRSMVRQRRLRRPRAEQTPLQMAVDEKNLMTGANLAMMEYFSILDAAEGFSSAGRADFLRQYGTEIFRRVLKLQIAVGGAQNVRDVLDRCRRHDFFDDACRRDARLKELADNIDSGVGCVSLVPCAGMEKTVAQVRHPGGEVVWQNIVGTTRIILPEGENEIMLDNGVNMRFSVIPGGSEQAKIPPPPGDADEAVIPEDDFQMEIPGIGSFLCEMDAFVITRRALPGKFDHESAAKILQSGRFASWRLPRRQELLKAFSPGSDGEPEFYGVRLCREPVLLQSGEFFDPGSGAAVKNVPGNAGRLYPVRELSDTLQK